MARTIERTIDFEVIRFEKSFIGATDDFELGWAGITALGRTVNIYGAIIDGERYNLTLQWRTNTQGFEIIRINRLEQP